jgi:hypothetical protein
MDVTESLNLFHRLEQRLRGTIDANAYGTRECRSPRTERTPAGEDAVIAIVELWPWRSLHDIAPELGLFQPWILEVLHGGQLHLQHYSRSAHVST